MPLSSNASQRNEILAYITAALGTLRTAVSTVNICEDVEGCKSVDAAHREIAVGRIDAMRTKLDDLSRLLLKTPAKGTDKQP